jgi:PAS domain S-box-containing protein
VSTIDPTLVLSTLGSCSTEGIIVCDSEGKIVSLNAAAERLFGTREAQVIGQFVSRLLPDRPLEVKGAARMPLTPCEATATEGIHANGQRLELRCSTAPVVAPGGEKVGHVVLVHDAGASDADLDRLNLALAAARLGTFSWDAVTDVVTFSRRAAEIFRIPPGPFMTWTAMRKLLHPDDREPSHTTVEQSLQARRDYTLEYRLINGGHERWIAARGRGKYDRRGEVLGMIGVIQDITCDRLLLRLDDAVRPLVKPDDIVHTCARMLGEHLDVNRCAYAYVEADQDTFTIPGNYTNAVASMVGRYTFRQFGAEYLRLMRAGKPFVVEDARMDSRISHRDLVSYEHSDIRAGICVPILKSGKLVAAMAVHTIGPREWSSEDLELVQQVASRCWESIERARVERERESLLESAEAANRAKDEFLAMLGHELRNPLAPIATALHLMKLRDGPASERERTVIERQVKHLTRLVDDLLDVSRIARGKVELKSEIVQLSQVVTRAIEVASPLLEQRAHMLTVDVPAKGLPVMGDSERLVQVVSNLLTNAGKYTPPGGRISVSGRAHDETVILRIRDNGMGMSKEMQRHAFEMFIQSAQPIDRAHGGLGLGLSIVRNLVERHGGTVSAHSEGPGKGSEFVVHLPKALPDALNRARLEERIAPHFTRSSSGIRVLVVDDNEDAAEMLALSLASLGCKVRVAHDGPGALRIAGDERFDAALLDIGLPVMDGYELATRLRELPTMHGARLVAVTGYGQQSDRNRALAAGFELHLVKPVEFRVIEEIVTGLPGRSVSMGSARTAH